VAAGTEVALVMTSGGRATLPTPPGDAPWAYVRAAAGDVEGWVPATELDGEPAGDVAFAVRGVAAHDDPRGRAAAAPRPVVTARGRQLVRSPDALGIAVPDARTIVFTTSQPTPYFVPLTDSRALRTLPIEAVARSPLHWTEPARIVTSGPLHLVSWRPRDGLTLVRSPTYWDPTAVKFDRLEVLSIDDQAAATNLYFTAACDATTANVIPSTYLPVLGGEQRGRPYADYHVSTSLGVYFAWINTKRLTNRHLRRALALAIDRTVIPQFTHGGEVPTAQLTPGTPIAQLSPADLAACGVTHDTPGTALVMTAGELCYVPPPGLDYDLAAARQEIALARAELGDAFPKSIEYRYNAGSEAHKQIAEYLQASWAKIGVDVTLASEDFNAMMADGRAGNYDIMRFGNQGNLADTESEFLPLLRCDSPDNRGHYCNPEYERLLDAAQPIRDRRARNAALRQAEAVMIGDAPLIPLYVYTLKTLVKPYVRDYGNNVINQPPLWRAWIAK
jgi:ABC-type oligopeptide transport system substrate-binding subunit